MRPYLEKKKKLSKNWRLASYLHVYAGQETISSPVSSERAGVAQHAASSPLLSLQVCFRAVLKGAPGHCALAKSQTSPLRID